MGGIFLTSSSVKILALLPVLLIPMTIILELNKDPKALNAGQLLDNDYALDVAQGSWQTDPQYDWSTPVELKANADLPIESHSGPKIAFATTTAASLDTIKLWVRYHKSLGIGLFYIFTNGQVNHSSAKEELERFAAIKIDPGCTVVLVSNKGTVLKVFPNNDKLKYMTKNSRSWNETWLSAFFHKPCNHELFVMQSLNMEVAIKQARVDGVEWLFHIDTDELLYPGGTTQYNLQQYFSTVPKAIDTVIFPNYEGLAEHDNVETPFLEVSLFKKNFAHVMMEPFYKHYRVVARGNPNYFTTYGNGKSAVRIQPRVRPNGAHRWFIYGRKPKEMTADQVAVLHYVYNRFEDLNSRRDRCDCAPTEEDVKRCFILAFDREAFLASSLKTDEELRNFYNERLVWGEARKVTELLKAGLFTRIYSPQVMMKLFKQLPDCGLPLAEPNESKQTILDALTIPT